MCVNYFSPFANKQLYISLVKVPIEEIMFCKLIVVLGVCSLLSGCGDFGYIVKRNDVIFAVWDGSGRAETTMEGADPDSFQVLKNHLYALDTHSVYYGKVKSLLRQMRGFLFA